MTESSITFDWVSAERGRVRVFVRSNGELIHSDDLNIARDAARLRFAVRLNEKFPGIDVANIDAELLRIADKANAPPDPAMSEPAKDTPEARDAARDMLRDPELIRLVVDDIALLGVAGEKTLAATVYLVGTSRLLSVPLAAIVQGLTCSGKSYVIDVTARLFPPETVLRAHKMTPEALVHMPMGGLVHRFVVGGERSRRQDDANADATRALREMLSGQRLTKLIPMKTAGGKIETVQIDQPGPIAYIESTTLQNILDEDRNRCLVLATDESPEQTRRIIDGAARRKARPIDGDGGEIIIAKHHAAQRMLKGCTVVIPFAERLAGRFPYVRADARRAFGQMMSMIEAVTFLHQRQRIDEPADGAVIEATEDDYRIAHRLLAGPFARALGDGLSDAARHFGGRLRGWFAAAGEPFTTRDIIDREKIIGDASTIREYVRALARAGRLEQVEESKGPKPARYKLAGPVDDVVAVAGLPEVFEIFGESAPDKTESSVE